MAETVVYAIDHELQNSIKWAKGNGDDDTMLAPAFAALNGTARLTINNPTKQGPFVRIET